MNALAITMFILMIPGIVTLIVIDKLIVHKQWGSFFFALYSIILGIFSYCLLQLCFWVPLIIRNIICTPGSELKSLDAWKVIKQTSSLTLNPLEIILATIIAIPLGFMISGLIQYKVLNKIAKVLKVSTKYGDENLFSYYLTADEIDWVYIRDKESDTIFQGKVESYSENEKIQEIVLTDVTAYSYYAQEELYETPSLYLCKELGKLQIEQIPESKFKKGEANGKT